MRRINCDGPSKNLDVRGKMSSRSCSRGDYLPWPLFAVVGEGKSEQAPMAFLLRTAPRSKTRMLVLMRERNHQRLRNFQRPDASMG